MVKNLPAMQETWVGKIPWGKECLPAPVFLPRKSHGQRSLAGYSSWGPKKVRRDLVIATKWKGNLRKSGHMYAYIRFALQQEINTL